MIDKNILSEAFLKVDEMIDKRILPVAWAELPLGTGGFITTDESLANNLTPLYNKESLYLAFLEGQLAEAILLKNAMGIK